MDSQSFPNTSAKRLHLGDTTAQWLAAAPGLIPSFPKKIQRKIVNFAEVNQMRWFEESGQWLENADRTYLVLACGKLVLQKNACTFVWKK